MYKLKGISRRAIIASLALFGLFAIFGTDETFENVQMRNLEEKTALGVCHGWCIPHPDPWDMKCTFKKCGGCSKCAELEEEKKKKEEENLEVSAAKFCDDWCGPHADPWDMKCTFKRCNGCGQCLEQEDEKPLEKEEKNQEEVSSENNCDDWCFSETNPFEWHAKCTFRRCNGCRQCFDEEKKDETFSLLDGTDSNPIIVVEEEQQEGQQQEEDNEQSTLPSGECESWCLPHPDPWDMKCTFKHCDGCDKCLEEKPAELSNADQNRFVGWGTDLERYLMTHL